MANYIESETRVRVYKDFDLSFARNPNSNDIAKKVDVNAVKQALKSLLFTQLYERPFRPRYGSRIRSLLFENFGRSTARLLSNEIDQAIKNYEPRVRVEDIYCEPDIDNHTYNVTIEFYVIGFQPRQTLGIVLDRLR